MQYSDRDKNNHQIFECESCSETFSQKKYLQNHMKYHLQGTKCDHCGKLFISELSLKSHSRIHKVSSAKTNRKKKKKEPCECELCGKILSQKRILKAHMKTHTTEERCACDQCDKTFASKQNLYCHMQTHLNARPFHCDYCGKNFARPYSLKLHLNMHREGFEPHKCEDCGKSFEHHENWKKHVIPCRKTKRLQQHKCDKCDQKFNSSMKLELHVKIFHCTPDRCELLDEHLPRFKKFPTRLQHECDKCDQKFNSSIKLKLHVKNVHCTPDGCEISDEHLPSFKTLMRHEFATHETFKCSECDMGFHQPTVFKKHMISHGDFKPFNCTQCDMKFSWFSLLNLHSKKHKNPTFQCEECGRKFYYSSKLYNHMMNKHRAGYICNLCDRVFKSLRKFKYHTTTHSHKVPLLFMCNLCGKGFQTQRRLSHHHSRASNCNHVSKKRLNVCKFCGEVFKWRKDWQCHLKTHVRSSSQRPFECPQCDKNFNYFDYLEEHLKDHDINMSFNTGEFGKKLAPAPVSEKIKQSPMLNPINLKSGAKKKPFNCQLCDKGYHSEMNLESHMQEHVPISKNAGVPEKSASAPFSLTNVVASPSFGMLQRVLPVPGFRPASNLLIINSGQQVPNVVSHSNPTLFNVVPVSTIVGTSSQQMILLPGLQSSHQTPSQSNVTFGSISKPFKPDSYGESSKLSVPPQPHLAPVKEKVECGCCGKQFVYYQSLQRHMQRMHQQINKKLFKILPKQ